MSFQRLCEERIAPRAAGVDRSGEISRESWDELREHGYFGLFHPREAGGSGADGKTLAAAMEALASACASTAWSATISTGLCGNVIRALGTDAHREQWLRPFASGEKIGSFAVIERTAGSEMNRCRTVLRPDAGGRDFVLDGEKARVSNAGVADVAVVFARFESGQDTGYAVVDLRKPGVRRARLSSMGLRGLSFGSLSFEGVRIAAEDVIRCAELERMLDAVEWGQLFQACCACGIAEAALRASVSFTQERIAFGRPIATFEGLQVRLADMRLAIDAARLLSIDVAERKTRGEPARDRAIMAKIYATEMAVRVTEQAMSLHGSLGYLADHALERLHRDSLAGVPAGAANDRLRELLGCEMTGVNPFSYGEGT
jgi:butyryl-CoA dehydrogenase